MPDRASIPTQRLARAVGVRHVQDDGHGADWDAAHGASGAFSA
jgi:hypothetical protein